MTKRDHPRGVGFSKNGGLPGVHAWIEHLPIGVDWALFWNGGLQPADGQPTAQTRFLQAIHAELRQIETWPDLDLFPTAGSP